MFVIFCVYMPTTCDKLYQNNQIEIFGACFNLHIYTHSAEFTERGKKESKKKNIDVLCAMSTNFIVLLYLG